MARIRCRYTGCVHLDDGNCTAVLINLDPEEGCLTFSQIGDPYDEEWDVEDDDLDGYDEWEDESDYDRSLYDDEDDDL